MFLMSKMPVMNRLTVLFSLCILGSACSSEPAPSNTPEPPPPAVEAEAEDQATAEAPGSSNIQLADIKFAPFDPEKPEGIHVYSIVGNPGEGPFNAIVRLPPGHTSPLHTHTASYSGVSLTDGHVHSATAELGEPLPKGSTWHQPAGEPHVDACRSEEPCLFAVFFDGAVDMNPAKEPAAEPKATVNRADQMKWVEAKGGVMMSVIHGNPKEGAFQALLDFPAGMATNVHTHSAAFSGALVSGTHHRGPAADQLVTLNEGAVWHEVAEAPHMEKCGDGSRCIIVASMDGAMDTSNVELTPATE